MSSGKFKWSRENLISYLGGDENDLNTVKIELTNLLLDHGMMHRSCANLEGRVQQEKFILCNLPKIHPYVRSCTRQRLQGLMGLVSIIKRNYKSGERYKIAAARRSQSLQSGGEERINSEGELDDKANVITATNPGKSADESTVITEAPTHEDPIVIASHDTVETASTTTFNPIEHRHEGFLGAAEEQPLPNEVQMTSTNNRLTSNIKTEARNPPTNKQPPTSDSKSFNLSHSFLTRNIWVINETDPTRHGLCTIQELRTSPHHPSERIPNLNDLNFIDWIIIIKDQCGYDETIHRLEYRPASTVAPWESV
ncbi:uncharacterized protein BO80DRAFT_488272 [Aspergillus ibericus CBS 121593]|uniref:Uncharacterized protein n=1 Tax=Aspergillus ibericus CBS 121593 TaxID=1448316 RepID=A0A395H669_9EURO|nr:hypothetical protein BO80DRAFT_488272 [Aspergillus ibericus CBS 121593]RAL03391.1 hypothetical protein BO80DRAFT_488272 [Aspergillus ibericus CBS 121593]